ncbi:MAG: hypothetical protein WA864_31950 [Acetobacteraceae bacterium]
MVARSYLAGSTASDSYVEAANAAHEVHAGIGSDPQYGLTLYTRISRTMYELLGPPSWQRWRMADALVCLASEMNAMAVVMIVPPALPSGGRTEQLGGQARNIRACSLKQRT